MLSALEQNFIAYAQSFYTNDKSIDRNLQLKLAHSFRVRNEMEKLAQHENFAPNLIKLALRTALLHDLSRFEQFSCFHTFNDAESFDHGDRSAELATESNFLTDLSDGEQQDVLTAIRVHNKLAIPDELSGQARTLAQAIRDTDKLDIIPILLEHLANPENKSIVFELSQTPELSPLVRESIARGECPRHCDMRTVTDFIASKIVWVNDLNFNWSKREFRRRKYIEQIMKFLPDIPELIEKLSFS
ncbi:MAG: HD domain-containing protein [Victivallales bacterium]|jgi:hypothetical protein|nr:HD domain-containing protein [Victivallales bacterium]